MAQYDSTITNIMLNNGINFSNLHSILDLRSITRTYATYVSHTTILDQDISIISRAFLTGTIFVLPYDVERILIYWIPITSEEIKKVIKWKAFI